MFCQFSGVVLVSTLRLLGRNFDWFDHPMIPTDVAPLLPTTLSGDDGSDAEVEVFWRVVIVKLLFWHLCFAICVTFCGEQNTTVKLCPIKLFLMMECIHLL